MLTEVRLCRRQDIPALSRQVDVLFEEINRRPPRPTMNNMITATASPAPAAPVVAESTTMTPTDAKAQAAREWDTDPAARSSASSRELYVWARASELDGTHRTCAALAVSEVV